MGCWILKLVLTAMSIMEFAFLVVLGGGGGGGATATTTTFSAMSIMNVSTTHVLKNQKTSSSCNIYQGSWIYDESYPLYDSLECPYIRREFNCLKYGRPDHMYLKYRWQPQGCKIPRLDGKRLLMKLRGKNVLYVGDSVSSNHWTSMVCLLRAAVPLSNITLHLNSSMVTVTFHDYDVSVSIFHSLFLVDIINQDIGRVLNLSSINDGNTWKKYDVLIFNTWLWWYRKGIKQPWDYITDGNKIVKDIDRMEAFRRGLTTWVNWIKTDVNTSKIKVFFQGITPSHYNGSDWHKPGITNCGEETEPISGSSYLGGVPAALTVLKEALSGIKNLVELLDITTLSQLRKDGHPSKYNGLGGMDCTHWCVAGVTDTWNQLIYSQLI